MSTNIFEAPSGDNRNELPHTVPVDQLVGDDKPYKTADDLAKAKVHADHFIETLKAELQQMRDENSNLKDDLKTRARVEALLDQMTQRNSQEDDGDNYSDNSNNYNPPSSQPDTRNIDALIESKITKIERERTSNQNRSEAVRQLREKLGNSYLDRLKARSEELGLSPQEMNELAGRSPRAFIDLVVPRDNSNREAPLNVPPSSGSPPRGQGAGQPGTPEWYKQMKKDNPRRYWSPEVQGQMHRDAIKAAQENRDFEI